MKTVVVTWIQLLGQLAVLLLANVGALLMLLIGLAVAISVVITVSASANGHIPDPQTLSIVRSSFDFVLGAVSAIGILSALERITNRIYKNGH